METYNGKKSLSEHREKDNPFLPFFRRKFIELNNISIIFLHFGKHQIALNMLADAIKMMNYSISELENDAYHQKDADKIIRRDVEALGWQYELLTGNSDSTYLFYITRRLHDIDLDGMDIFHRVWEETSITIFNIALIHQKHWINTSSNGYLQKYLSLLKMVIDIFKKENQCTSLERLHLLINTLSTMGGVYIHLGQHSFSEA